MNDLNSVTSTLRSAVASKLKAFARRRADFFRRCRLAERTVGRILRDVEKSGDAAVLRYTRKWDKVLLKTPAVTEEEFEQAHHLVETSQRLALEAVIARFHRFYESQRLRAAPFVDETGFYSERVSPIDRVGLYVPGGTHPLISTLLMLAVPAKVAGVPERFVATPPNADGTIAPLMAEAAKMTGVTAVYKMGGAQAIAAFAYGTRSVPKVDKIFGPGNLYVTTAKKLLFGAAGIDILAGPSELVVIADDTASSDFIAEDLLAQAEHGPDSLSLLLTTSSRISANVKKRVATSIRATGAEPQSRRGRISLKQIFIVTLKTVQDCAAAAAEVAPEHLGLCVAEPEKLLSAIGPAGAIFLGTSCAAYGDYIAGPNHTLPTAGSARFSSPLSLESFFRRSSILKVRDPEGDLARIASIMAEWEGLKHHARSLHLRAEK